MTLARLHSGLLDLLPDRDCVDATVLAFGTASARVLDRMLLPSVALEVHQAASRGELSGASANERYRAFWINNPDLPFASRFADLYPVLSRAIDTFLESSSESVLLAVRRYVSDARRLHSNFGVEPNRLRAVRPSGSDRHRGGGQVLYFDHSDQTIVYKPASLDAEVFFSHFIGCLELPAELTPGVTDSMSRRDYGWARYIRYSLQRDAGMATAYWRRAGALLAIADILNYTDGHLENLIVTNSRPILVDLETVLQCDRPEYGADEERSILFTGLFQRLDAEATGWGMMAALQTNGTRYTERFSARAIHDRTDALLVRFNTPVQKPCLNYPILATGEYSPLPGNQDAVIDGLQLTYQHLRSRLGVGLVGQLREMSEGLRVRQILRATMYYMLILRRLEQPAQARSFDSTRGLLERQLSPDAAEGADASVRAAIARVLPYEIRALEQLDVPIFYSRPNSRDLWTGDGEHLPDFFEETALDQVARRLMALDAAYVERQCELVRAYADVGEPIESHAPAWLVDAAQEGRL